MTTKLEHFDITRLRDVDAVAVLPEAMQESSLVAVFEPLRWICLWLEVLYQTHGRVYAYQKMHTVNSGALDS